METPQRVLNESKGLSDFFFVLISSISILGILYIFHKYYESILLWAMANKLKFLSIPFFFLIVIAAKLQAKWYVNDIKIL